MKVSGLFDVPTVKILLMLAERSEVRYAELAKAVRSRGTLSISLRELGEEGLMERRIVSSKPIQAYYSLTEKGKDVAKSLSELKRILSK